jgi:enediyne core biosynthesis thioesterase
MKQNRAPRVNKKIKARLGDVTGIIENISTSGGFLKLNSDFPRERFNIELQLKRYKTIRMVCDPQWYNDIGVGFKVINVMDAKTDQFIEYVESQVQALKHFGVDRVFKTEITVTLKDTNVFGSVYFSNYIEYQGVVREKFLLETLPEIHEMLSETRIALATIETYHHYICNAYFGDTLVAELTTSKINGASCRLNINFKIKNTGKTVGKGYQRFCVVGSQGRVVRIPDKLLKILDYYQQLEVSD